LFALADGTTDAPGSRFPRARKNGSEKQDNLYPRRPEAPFGFPRSSHKSARSSLKYGDAKVFGFGREKARGREPRMKGEENSLEGKRPGAAGSREGSRSKDVIFPPTGGRRLYLRRVHRRPLRRAPFVGLALSLPYPSVLSVGRRFPAAAAS